VTDDKKRTFVKIERKLSEENNVKNRADMKKNYLKGRGKHRDH
jgi:hypothetical protein